MTKVKLFDAAFRIEKMEKDINEFILGKKVSSIEFRTTTSSMSVMVVYDE